MKYIDKNLIIDRYINGTMSPSEIQSFHTMLETDNELRSMFQAENIINSTMAKERYALEAMNHSQSYATFLKGLANSIPQTTAATSAVGAGKAVSWLAGISTAVKVVVSTVVVTGAVAVGTFVMQPTPQNDTMPTLDNRQQQHDIPVQYPQSNSDGKNTQGLKTEEVNKNMPIAAPANTVKDNETTPAQPQLRKPAQQRVAAHDAPPQEKKADAVVTRKDEGIKIIDDPNLNISVQSDSAKK